MIWLSGPAGSQSSNPSASPFVTSPAHSPRACNTRLARRIGLTRFANRGHIARAALEATAFQTSEVLQAMEKDSGVRLDTLRVDGGMTDNDLLMQCQADIINRTVVRPAIKETTALGAAFAAGLAIGVFRDADDLRSRWVESRRWEPRMKDETREHMVQRWNRAVSRSLDWV